MEITHPGRQLILYFDVCVKFVLYIFHYLLHTLQSILLYELVHLFDLPDSVVIYSCLTNIISILFIFVISFYVCVYMPQCRFIHIYVRFATGAGYHWPRGQNRGLRHGGAPPQWILGFVHFGQHVHNESGVGGEDWWVNCQVAFRSTSSTVVWRRVLS